MKKKLKQWIGCLLFLVIFIAAVPIFPKAAQKTDAKKTIVVGYTNSIGFLTIDSNGSANGYAAEYLNKITDYTNWNYKYVCAPWNECLKMLKDGRIDLLMPAEYSPKLAESFIYSSDTCYIDYAILVGRKDDDSLYYEDIDAFDGMRVGMTEENGLNTLFDTYQQKHGFQAQDVYYDSDLKQSIALKNKELDAVISGCMNISSDQKILAKIGYKPAYFIMSKGNDALMDELNNAMYHIRLEYPSYTYELYEEYYSDIERQIIAFTPEEADYIENADPIRILYETNDYPFEYLDSNTSEVKGIYLDILDMIFDDCGLTYELIPSNDKSSWQRVSDGDADLLLSAYDSAESRQKFDLDFSDAFYSADYSLVGKMGSSIDVETALSICTIEANEGERNMIRRDHPSWDIMECETLDSCLDCVTSGACEAAMVNTISLQMKQGNSPRNNLIVFSSDNIKLPISFGINQDTDPLMKAVLNKGIKKTDTDKIHQIVFNNLLDTQPEFSLSYCFHAYPVQSALVIITLVLIIAFILFCYFSYQRNSRQNIILQSKNRELENAIQLQHELQLENEQDPLTGIKNKKAIQKLCLNVLNHLNSHRCAMLILDIDNFKHVNDTYGHLEGDNIIKLVAVQLKKAFAAHIIGRIGGDEFLVMVAPLDDTTELDGYMDTFYRYLTDATCEDIVITCSCGIAFSRPNANEYEEMFLRADRALYTAKRNGKNQYAVEE